MIIPAIDSGTLTFIAAGIFGMISHYAKKKSKGETKVNFREWFSVANISGSLAAFGAFVAATAGALSAGIVAPDMDIYTVIMLGFSTGFAIDSGFNSDGSAKIRTGVAKVKKPK